MSSTTNTQEKRPELQDRTPSQAAAAERIQRAWRKKNSLKEQYLTPETRWKEATRDAKAQATQASADEGHNTGKDYWRRAAFRVSQLQDGNQMLAGATNVKDDDAARKQLELQHWLELIDGKHRYGSNLKFYFRRWKEEDTEDNFFKWLDRGAGKELSLKECPREQLEKERITYFTSEQRLNYLVNIDSEGKLRWARNDELVDTTPGRWKDAGNGQGIILDDAPEASGQSALENAASISSPRSSFSGEEGEAAHHYVGPAKGKTKATRAFRKHLTIHGIVDKLMKKTVRRNTWIYVSDKNFNMFVGIKVPGTFQHSTFLGGGLVTSAGLITVHEGVIHTLSPLSGHYRTSISHFRRFLGILEQRGVDMDKVEISKAEAALWFIEHLGKLKKRQSALFGKGKQKAKEVAASAGLVSDSDRREILEGRKKAKAKADKEKTEEDSEQAPPEKQASSSIEKAKADTSENIAEQSSPKRNEAHDKQPAIGNGSAGLTKSAH